MRFTRYSAEIELFMQQLYASLSERDRRRYAAVEAIKLGHGGIVYLIHLFGCSERTIRNGIAELYDPPTLPVLSEREKKGLFGNCREMPQDIVVIIQQSSSRSYQC